MKIDQKSIAVRALFDGYRDEGENGVFGYGGKLNIRPPYQREFIYKDKQRDAVLHTLRNGFPLNVMYWATGADDRYEVIDGQQRTLSICQYVNGDFSIDYQFFHNLTREEQDQILDYELMIYFCTGNEREKLDWFKVINIAGEKLATQELRNAIYTGPWLADARQYFSKINGPAANLGKDYMSGTPIRQDYLETTLDWISGGNIEAYMSTHQNDVNANELKLYFTSVLKWVEMLFPKKRSEMKSVPWGNLYNEYHDASMDSKALEEQVSKLMMDEDVTKKAGIYSYVLSGDPHHLNLRAFTQQQKREAYERQNGICAITKEPLPIDQMEADHIIAWIAGGRTDADNCQMVSKLANRRKSDS